MNTTQYKKLLVTEHGVAYRLSPCSQPTFSVPCSVSPFLSSSKSAILLENVSNTTVIINPIYIREETLLIQSCTNASIYILSNVERLFLIGCKGVNVYFGAVNDIVLLCECSDVTVSGVCGQFVVDIESTTQKDLYQIDAYIYTQKEPLIRFSSHNTPTHATKFTFGPCRFWYDGMGSDIISAGFNLDIQSSPMSLNKYDSPRILPSRQSLALQDALTMPSEVFDPLPVGMYKLAPVHEFFMYPAPFEVQQHSFSEIDVNHTEAMNTTGSITPTPSHPGFPRNNYPSLCLTSYKLDPETKSSIESETMMINFLPPQYRVWVESTRNLTRKTRELLKTLPLPVQETLQQKIADRFNQWTKEKGFFEKLEQLENMKRDIIALNVYWKSSQVPTYDVDE